MIKALLIIQAGSIIALSAIVSDEAWLLVTELGNWLRVAVASLSGRTGRHVARGYGYPPRHRSRVVTL